MISFSSLAVADEAEEASDIVSATEETNIDNETVEETEIMNNSIGAEIRLLQLEKAITKNLLKGERAVEVLKALGHNTSELEAILDEMRLLLAEVQEADPEAHDSVQIFVDLKSDARALTKQFRDKIRELLDDAKLNEIREQIREMTNDELENYSKRIRNRIRQLNRNQLHRLYGIIGETNETLAEEYENGNITVGQIKSQVCKTVNQMTKEKKNQIFSELKEYKIRRKINAQVSADDAATNFQVREQTRLNNRLQKAETTNDAQLQQQIQNRIGNKTNNGNGKGK